MGEVVSSLRCVSRREAAGMFGLLESSIPDHNHLLHLMLYVEVQRRRWRISCWLALLIDLPEVADDLSRHTTDWVYATTYRAQREMLGC
jgi:hypothetical protein